MIHKMSADESELEETRSCENGASTSCCNSSASSYTHFPFPPLSLLLHMRALVRRAVFSLISPILSYCAMSMFVCVCACVCAAAQSHLAQRT